MHSPCSCLDAAAAAGRHCRPAPPQVTISLLQRAMDESGKHKFLIDGFPRNEENRASFEKQVRRGTVAGGGLLAAGGTWLLSACNCAAAAAAAGAAKPRGAPP